MARDKTYEGYVNGLKNAWKIVVEAKQDGRDPEEALADEIKFRTGQTKIYMPAMTRKEIDRAEHEMQIFTIHSILAVALIILWEEHNFRHRALNRFAKRFRVYADALVSGSIDWGAILDCLAVECDINLDRKEFFQYDARK